jgi:hypothetical protein
MHIQRYVQRYIQRWQCVGYALDVRWMCVVYALEKMTTHVQRCRDTV